jgi:hypothetical protein
MGCFTDDVDSYGRMESTQDVKSSHGLQLGPFKLTIGDVEREHAKGGLFRLQVGQSTLFLLSTVAKRTFMAFVPFGESKEDGWRFVRRFTPFWYVSIAPRTKSAIFGWSGVFSICAGEQWRIRFGSKARKLGPMAYRHI